MNNRMSQEQERLLHDIGVLSFVLVEMNEYLDTHPYDRQAMDYFSYYNRILKQKEAEYAVAYGPLTAGSFMPECKEWKWALTPMPWEGGC